MNRWVGIAILVVSFCFIAALSKYEAADQQGGKEHRDHSMRYVERELGRTPEHGVELQLLKREGERYAVYRTIDEPQQVETVLQILKQAKWRNAKVQRDRMPDYKIETIRAEEPLTYAVWVTPRRNLELDIEGKSKVARLGDRESRILLKMPDSTYAGIWTNDDKLRPRERVPMGQRNEIER